MAVAAYWSTRITMLALELALLPLGGYWLDRQFGTIPWLTLAGVGLGLLIAGMDFYQLTKTQFGSKRNKPDDSRRRSNG